MTRRRTPEQELRNRIANRCIRLAVLAETRTLRGHERRVALLSELAELQDALDQLQPDGRAA